MTSLRFVGDLPLWGGLILALFVPLLIWIFYRRESSGLTGAQRWLLPFLRCTAFFLGIMILTGPVLHHRKVIGELGKVKIYIDTSESMNGMDPQMPVQRKLAVAESLGWIRPGRLDTSDVDNADQLSTIQNQIKQLLKMRDAFNADPGQANSKEKNLLVPEDTRNRLQELISKISLPASMNEEFQKSVKKPMEPITSIGAAEVNTLNSVLSVCQRHELELRARFQETIEQRVAGDDDDSFASAIALFDQTPRWKRVEIGLTKTDRKLLEKLREFHEVEVYLLADDQPRLLSQGDSETHPSDLAATIQETGFHPTTDLSSGILANQESSIDSAANSTAQATPSSAVVLISDGQHNRGPSPSQTAQILGGQGSAFFNVGVGAASSPSDLAVVGLDHPDLVFQKDRIRGSILVNDRIPAGKPILAEVKQGDVVLWQKQLVSENRGERRIDFDFSIEELVQELQTKINSNLRYHSFPLQLSASVTSLIDEADSENNHRSMYLAAITQAYKILILDGRSRWETRYLRNAFDRDEQWSVNSVIAGPGTSQKKLPRGDQSGQFPLEKEELLSYDLVVLGEIAPDLLSEQDYDWIGEFVEKRGGGLILLDGLRGKLAANENEIVRNLLPVHGTSATIDQLPEKLQLTAAGVSETLLRLESGQQRNQEFWSMLPPPRRFVPVEAAEDATVVAELKLGDKSYPALVTRRYGAGKVLYVSFDETWRWRFENADTWHQRAWNQLAKYAMPVPYSVSDQFTSIDTGATSYQSGEKIKLRMKLNDIHGDPDSDSIAEAMLLREGEVVANVQLQSDPLIPGVYHGLAEDLEPGEYQVAIRASGYADNQLEARGQFVVMPPETGETTQKNANETLLKQMASLSGGSYLREENLADLPDLLQPLSNGRVVESETLLWQSYWWFSAILILLAVEWMLRKRAGLL